MMPSGNTSKYKTYLTTTTSGDLTISSYLPSTTWRLLGFGTCGDAEIDKYIINENATILFWDDGTKTISKRHKDDTFDKELGFLFAYFYKKYNGSKASRKRVIDSIDYKKIKTFLFEFYVNDIGEDDYRKARRYLANLKVDKK